VNGGELLFLAVATCYCNDFYRGARKRGIEITGVQVEVRAEFGDEGEPAKEISYKDSVVSPAPRPEVLALVRHADSVAEIQNTLRKSSSVVLAHIEVQSTRNP